MADEMTPQIQTLSLEKTEQDGSSGVLEKPGDAAQQTPTILTWTPSLPPAQTVLVSPQSPAEGPQGRLPLNVMNWEAEVQNLAGLEEAAQGLRRLLGLKTFQGPMTTADCGAEKPKEVAAARREVGCQTDMAESQRAERGQREQPEQNRPRMEKTDTQSRTRVSDSEAYEGSRSAQEDLRGLRNNLVVLLTALLPQLDLTDISLETPDVDNILQQILEVNSLKL